MLQARLPYMAPMFYLQSVPENIHKRLVVFCADSDQEENDKYPAYQPVGDRFLRLPHDHRDLQRQCSSHIFQRNVRLLTVFDTVQ